MAGDKWSRSMNRIEERVEEQAGEHGDEAGGSRDYDPDRLFIAIRMSDSHGHSAQIGTRVHPRVDSLMARLVEQKIFPIKDKSHFVRLAIHHFLDMLSGLDPTVPGIMARIGGISDLVEDEKMAQEFDERMEEVGRLAQAHVGKGRPEMAKRLVQRVMREIEAMPGSPWKKVWEKTVKERFGHIAGGGKEHGGGSGI